MELDQLLFRKAWRFISGLNSKGVESEPPLTLEDIKSKLTVLASALSGNPIEVLSAEREGGWQDNRFLLPLKAPHYTDSEKAESFFRFRIVYLVLQKKLDLNGHPDQKLSLEESRQKATETSELVLNQMQEEYPAAFHIHEILLEDFRSFAGENEPDLSWLYGRWFTKSASVAKTDYQKNDLSGKDEKDDITTEIEGKPVDEAENVGVNHKSLEDYCLSHNFEKVETADEFDGVWRDLDGDDSLEDHEDAVKDLNLKHTVRSNDTVHSVYHSEIRFSAGIPEVTDTEQEAQFHYDEWNYKKKAYRKDYCAVREKRVPKSDPGYAVQVLEHHRKVLNELRKVVDNSFNSYCNTRYCKDGHEVDMDAFSDALADINAGESPGENLYIDKRKINRDVGVALLIDSSLSTGGYVNNINVLDIEKRAMILTGQILEENNIPFRIDSFHSQTRNHCSFLKVKGFESPWNRTKNLVAGLESEGYTRIGPALRHVRSIFENHDFRKKWVIMISDGKPNDYDRYEGRYGVEDVRKAIQELNQDGIHSYAVAIDSRAKFYLPRMFGQGNYEVLTHPDALPEALCRFMVKAVR